MAFLNHFSHTTQLFTDLMLEQDSFIRKHHLFSGARGGWNNNIKGAEQAGVPAEISCLRTTILPRYQWEIIVKIRPTAASQAEMF